MVPPSANTESTAAAGVSRRRWLVDLTAIIGLTLFVLLLFGRLIFTNRVLASGDVWTYFVPYRDYAATAILNGHLPLWNPYLFLGAPLLANSQAAVFYPLNVLLHDVARAINGTIVLHAWLGGLFTYLWLRHGRRLLPAAAVLGAVVFAGSGFVGGHVGQLNQLEAYIWLPALLWVWDWAIVRPLHVPVPPGKAAWAWRVAVCVPGVAALAVIFAVQLLAGHTQAWYISAVGLGLYGVVRLLEERQPSVASSRVRHAWRDWLRPALVAAVIVAAGLAFALGLAAVQLLPTFELSALSLRAGGLAYREVVSFSLRPQLLAFSLLPAYGTDLAQRFASPAYAEYVAYVSVSGLVLALWGAWRGARPRAALVVLALAGLLLALGAYNPLYFAAYKLVPGWDLFRAPARWMLLYTVGAAGLAALAVQVLLRPGQASPVAGRQRRLGQVLILAGLVLAAGFAGWAVPGRWTWLIWLGLAGLTVAALMVLDPARPRSPRTRQLGVIGLCLLVAGELLAASLSLPHTHPTAPEAVTSLRNAPAYLLSAEGRGRFLSLSGIRYDPGDQAALTQLFGPQLDASALYDLIVASKQKEIVAPNLSLLYRLESVDGYDGGLLPLARYVDVQRLFVADEQLVPDGRLREQLTRVPPVRLLNLLNTRFVITDKVYDVWIDNVYYDLQFDTPLAPGASWQQAVAPPFDATGIGVMTHLQGAGTVPDGTPVAQVVVTLGNGQTGQFTLHAGDDTAEGAWQSGMAHRQATVGHPWPDGAGQDYLTVISLTQPALVESIAVTATLPVGRLQLRGISLIDARTGTSQALVTAPDNAFRRVHSGDVKIYENQDLLDRAYVVPAAAAQFVPGRAAALAALRNPAFDPRRTVVIEAAGPAQTDNPISPPDTAGTAEITAYAPEQVVISATLPGPGYLVLSDANYPGWRAWVDGEPAPILTANLLVRAVALPAGSHRVEFRFEPDSLRYGALISFMATGVLVIFAAGAWRYRV
jgi:hypothetical protein